MMIDGHKLVKGSDSDELYLYLDFNYEFSKSFFERNENSDFKNAIANYIKNKKIAFKNGTIFLVVGGVLVSSMIFSNDIKKNINKLNDTNEVIYTENYTKLSPNKIYTVKKGDTLSKISKKNKLTVKELKSLNKLKSNKIFVGQKLVVNKNITSVVKPENKPEVKPETNITAMSYTVKKGDTLYGISKKYNLTVNELKSLNNMKSDTISIGQKLVVNKNVVLEVNHDVRPEAKPGIDKNEIKETTVTVYRSNGTILQLELEEYIIGVVAAEMPASFNYEALKVQATIARTYALKKISRNEVLTDTTSTQAYIDISQMKAKWGATFDMYYNKIVRAVKDTKGHYITYGGTYIDAVYYSTSNGYTENAVNVWGNNIPYLVSVQSNWDQTASSYLRVENKEFNTLMSILGLKIDKNTRVEILNKNNSGRVELVRIGENTYTGTQLRKLLGLRSTDFDIEVSNDKLIITTRGFGHGVGLSQYGANGMANEGYSYQEIIMHYYTGVNIVSNPS